APSAGRRPGPRRLGRPATSARRTGTVVAETRRTEAGEAGFAERWCLPGLNRLPGWALSIKSASRCQQGVKRCLRGTFGPQVLSTHYVKDSYRWADEAMNSQLSKDF